MPPAKQQSSQVENALTELARVTKMEVAIDPLLSAVLGWQFRFVGQKELKLFFQIEKQNYVIQLTL